MEDEKLERRIIFPKPGVAEVATFDPTSLPLGPTEVDIATLRTVISPGTELAFLHGALGMQGNQRRSFPVEHPGYANVGQVIAKGSDVDLDVGCRVYSMAPHASRVRVDIRDRFCVPVQDDVPDEHAVFVRLAHVSMTTMRTTDARAGDPVAVLGLGLIGNLAAQVFRESGMEVHGFDPSPFRRAMAVRSGIDSVYPAAADSGVSAGYRLVIECSGSAEAVASAVQLASDHGEIVMVGAPWRGEENSVPSSRLTRDIFFRFLRLRSGSEWEIPRQVDRYVPHSILANVKTGLRWISEDRIRVGHLITHRIDPNEIQSAYDGLLIAKEKYLGVVIKWS